MTATRRAIDDGQSAPGPRRPRTALWGGLAAALAIAALAFTFRSVEPDRLLAVLARADWWWLAAVAASVPAEQWLRGWKWGQILHDLRPVPTLRLFGAVMAGYFANIVVPVGISPLVRAWLVARRERLEVATVLLTTAVERFVDGVVFALLLAAVAALYRVPAEPPGLGVLLALAAAGSLLLFSGLLAGLFLVRHRLCDRSSLLGRALARLERAFGGRLAGLAGGLAAGIVWPRSRWRGAAVIGASLLMKLVSTGHFLWAGLAFGVLLPAGDYLLIMVIAGFSMILSRFVRIPGGGVLGAAFALRLLGVGDEQALAMVTVVHVMVLLTTVGIGALAFWRSGISAAELRRMPEATPGTARSR